MSEEQFELEETKEWFVKQAPNIALIVVGFVMLILLWQCMVAINSAETYKTLYETCKASPFVFK